MARPRKFTDAEFEKQHKAADSMLDLARRMNVSTVSVYKHCARMELKPIADDSQDEVAKELYEGYRRDTTVEELAAKYTLSPGVVRYHIRREIVRRWSKPDDVPANPMPTKLCHVKLVHELTEDESVYDDPGELSKRARVSQLETERYLQRLFEHRTKVKGRRSKKRVKAKR